jgi:hypothetical protein
MYMLGIGWVEIQHSDTMQGNHVHVPTVRVRIPTIMHIVGPGAHSGTGNHVSLLNGSVDVCFSALRNGRGKDGSRSSGPGTRSAFAYMLVAVANFAACVDWAAWHMKWGLGVCTCCLKRTVGPVVRDEQVRQEKKIKHMHSLTLLGLKALLVGVSWMLLPEARESGFNSCVLD